MTTEILKQKFYDDLVAATDPRTYDGRYPEYCLIGQYARANGTSFGLFNVSKISGVDIELVLRISMSATLFERSLSGSLAMAREILGLTDNSVGSTVE